ncbi:winged helix-turn-helix transcriptional regulator [Hoeflea sp.]|uniref:winged helix-turn-helix transcriptional regulator n=1 Tax=Hoeflea sp. TaxID=1940281 RepID=UPI003B01F6C8
MQNTDHEFRSRCSIARSLELLGDRWTLLIVRDLMWHGKHTFQELQTSEERMPTNQLSQRLKRLIHWGLVTREAYQDRPVRYRYELTGKGRALEPLLLQIMRWGHENLDGGLYDPVQKTTVSAGRC